MTTFLVRRRRTGWDIIVGTALILLAVFLLADTAIATLISVLTFGWLVMIAGFTALVAALLRIGKSSFWLTVISAACLTVLGLVIVRHPGAAAVTLTLVAGTTVLAGGILRLGTAFRLPEGRTVATISGAAAVLLGFVVLFDLIPASFTLLGWLLGVQVLLDGISILFAGRTRVATIRTDDSDLGSADLLAEGHASRT